MHTQIQNRRFGQLRPLSMTVIAFACISCHHVQYNEKGRALNKQNKILLGVKLSCKPHTPKFLAYIPSKDRYCNRYIILNSKIRKQIELDLILCHVT